MIRHIAVAYSINSRSFVNRLSVETNHVFRLRRLEIVIADGAGRAATAHPADDSGIQPSGAGPGSDSDYVQLASANGAWCAALHLSHSSDHSLLREAVASGAVLGVVGDAGEVTSMPASSPYANACVISLDLRGSTIRVGTSLTGLPPVFILRRGAHATLSCPFLPETARGSFEPDLDGLADMLRWGHPLDGRTLRANVQVAPSSASISVTPEGALDISALAPWPSLQEVASLTGEEILEAQLAAFAESAGHIRTDSAFMSLSGGLDSRTSLVALLQHGRRIPCVTMASSPESLDVRLAKAFCDAHGLEHHTVLLGADFYRRCPELLLRSADLTGGVSCLSQTADLFLYESLSKFTTRISGNLGNQVGRGGVESLSAYQPRPDVFAPAVRERLLRRPIAPWFIPRLAGQDYGETLFGQEVHYWSIANYVVGSSRAYQLTPYADRRLMQLSRLAFARDPELRRPTWKTLRARDLRHRFAGTPRERSFQRQFLIKNDSEGRLVPLNWGWRAGGGWSIGWCLTAIASAADAGLIKLSTKSRVLRPSAAWLSGKLSHRSALVDWRHAISTRLRELAMDTFESRTVRQAGVFEAGALERMLRQHFSGAADYHHTVSVALEIALGISVRQSSTRAPHAADAACDSD